MGSPGTQNIEILFTKKYALIIYTTQDSLRYAAVTEGPPNHDALT